MDKKIDNVGKILDDDHQLLKLEFGVCTINDKLDTM